MVRALPRLAVAVLTAALSASVARADFMMSFDGNSPVENLDITINGTHFGVMPTGVFNFTTGAGAAAYGIGPNLQTFCTEVFRQVAPQGTSASYSIVALSSGGDIPDASNPTATANYITELWGRHFTDTTTADGAAAFQLAIWKLVYDPVGDTDLTNASGHENLFLNGSSATSTAASLAATWLGQLSGDTSQFSASHPGFQLVGLNSSSSQGQIGMTPVPAPPALALGLVGVVGLFGRRWVVRKPA